MEATATRRKIDIKKLCDNFASVAESNPKDILKESVYKYDDIYSILTADLDLERGIIRAKNGKELEDLLRVSCLFNDATFFSSIELPETMHVHTLPNEFTTHAKLRIPDILESILLDNNGMPDWKPVLMTGRDKHFDNLVPEFSELFKSRRLFPLPMRAVLIKEASGEPEPKHVLLPTNPYHPIDQWTIDDLNENAKVWTANQDNRFDTLVNFSLPFLKGINFRDLNKIIDDEYDLLASLRSELRNFSEQIKNISQEKWNEYSMDVVQPRIDRIHRKFKSISQSKRLQLEGIALGAVTSTYCAITVGAYEQIITAGGIALAAAGKVVADHGNQLSDIRNDPFYLFWRIQQNK